MFDRFFRFRSFSLPKIMWTVAAFSLLIVLTNAITFGQDEQPLVQGADAENAIRGQYIVVYNDRVENSRVANSAETIVQQHDAKILYTYDTAIKGFAATLSEEAVVALSNDPNVAYIEADSTVTIADTQNNPTWGLDRIDQPDLPLDNAFDYDTSGDGVHAYIIDTGVLGTHNEFSGRFGGGFSTINDGNGFTDCNGHGTHVAGTIGGTRYGVAKDATIYAVRVLSCTGSGTTSGVIAGVNWVTNNHNSPAVANMSLGGGLSLALNSAVANSINAGVTYAVAAGNSSTNACNVSPASESKALTVGSSTNQDARSYFSNIGPCVDIFAPGSNITAAWHTGNTRVNTISGTSMASPHVAGAVALYLEANPDHTPAQVSAALTDRAVQGRLTNIGSGSPNLLLCASNCTFTPPPPTPTPPTPANLVFETGSMMDVESNIDFGNWIPVSLDKTFNSPVVIVSIGYEDGTPPMFTRVRNASSSQFEVQLVRMDGSADRTTADIYYLVVEEGIYNVAQHGVNLEAVKFTSTVTNGKNNWNGEARSYHNSYTQPVVVGQVMTQNDPLESVFWASGATFDSAPTADSLRIGKQVGSDEFVSRSDETIGYVVVEAGSGTLNGLPYMAGVGADIVGGFDDSPPYVYSLPDISSMTSAVVSSNGMDGNDGGWPILYGSVVGESNLNLAIDEDQFADSERNHTTEQVAFVAFGESPTAPPTATPAPPTATPPPTAVPPTPTAVPPTPTVVPPTPTELVIETGSLADVDNDGWTQLSLDNTFTSPVVVASANYGAGEPPMVVRVRNAVGSQFEMQIARRDGSAATASADVYYLVVEEGAYNVADHGINLEAVKFTSTVTNRKSNWVGEARAYQNSYSQPVVMGQVMSDNDAAASVFWASGASHDSVPTASSLRIGKQVGEDSNVTRADETVGYVVVEAGSGILNDLLYVAGVGADIVQGPENNDNQAYVYALPDLPSVMSAVVSSSGMDGNDGGWPVLFGNVVGESNLNLVIDEDTIGDSERYHATEQVAFMAFGDSMQAGDEPQLVHGVAENVTSSAWQTVTLADSYDSMVVVASANYDETSDPLVVRVRNASGNQFEVMVAPMDAAPAAGNSPVDVYYTVVEEGVYSAGEHGAKMEAVKYLSTRTDAKNSWLGQQRSYQNAYSQPVVVGQVMSANDAAASQFWARGSSVASMPASTALFVGKHVGEDPTASRADETIGYIVFESGSATVNGVELLAAVGDDTVRGITDSAPFVYDLGNATIDGAVVSSAAMDGNNGGWPVLYGATPFAGGLQLAIDEDQLADAERRHTTEQVAFVVFGDMTEASADFAPPDEAPASNAIVFTGRHNAGQTISNLASSLIIDEETVLITEDTAIEGDLRIDSRVFVIAVRNSAGELEATFVRALFDLSRDSVTFGRVTSVSAESIEIDSQSFAIDENTTIDGNITTGDHVAIIDNYDNGVLNRSINHLDVVKKHGVVTAISHTTITMDGETFALNRDSYIVDDLRVGDTAYVGTDATESTAMIIDANLVPTAISLSSQTAANSLLWVTLALAVALVVTAVGVSRTAYKRD